MATTGTISSAGIGSGIDVNGIISKLMAIEQQPLNNLKTKEASYQAKLTAFGTLKGAFSSVQTAVDSLNSGLRFENMAATPSDATVLSASANTAATAGSYSINVLGQAQSQSIATNTGFSDMTSNLAGADGQIKIELGTTSGTTFTANSGSSPITIDISASNSSLGAVRDAINNAGAGVTARIVNVGGSSGDSYKLVVTSNSTGANQSMRITTWDSTGTTQLTDDTGLAQFSFDPSKTAGTGNEFAVNLAAQDAHIQVNNLDIYRPTNTISDAITGVTLTLTKTGTTNLTVAKDTSGVTSALQAFVTAYNAAAQQVRTLSAYNATTQTASILTGDSGARSLKDALTQMLNFSVTTESSNISTLADVGITIQRDGTLQFNQAKLASALSSNSNAVAQLFKGGYNGATGLASRLNAIMTGVMDNQNGTLATSTNGINSTITDIQNQETSLAKRLQQVQANYQAEFAAMDSTVSSWNTTSSYLTQQLAALLGTNNTNGK